MAKINLKRLRGPAMAFLGKENRRRPISSYEEALARYEGTNYEKTILPSTLSAWVQQWCQKVGIIEGDGVASPSPPHSSTARKGRPSKACQAQAFQEALLSVVELVRDLAGRMELEELSEFSKRLEKLGGLEQAQSLLEVARTAAAVLGTTQAPVSVQGSVEEEPVPKWPFDDSDSSSEQSLAVS